MDARKSPGAGTGAASEVPGSSGVFPIYPGNGVPPGSETWDWQERTAPVPWGTIPNRFYARNIVIPSVTVFRPADGTANGTAMIIAPGGAFHFLMMDHEGYDMARWANALGITAFVLKYRLARTPDDDAEMEVFRAGLGARLGKAKQWDENPPVREFMNSVRKLAEEDGRQAIRFVRAHAADWGIDPDRIGIAGYSAGGGVTMGPVFEHDAESRPDFAVPVYPAYRAVLEVPRDACPMFLVIADDDASVAPISTVRLYEAWHKAGVPVELHVFETGAHGFGMTRMDTLSDPWIDLLGNWLKRRGLANR